MAGVSTNIAAGEGPAYVVCALPYRPEVDQEAEWGLDTAYAIVEEAVDAFDPPHVTPRPARSSWPEVLQDRAKAIDVFEMMRSAYFIRGANSLPELNQTVPRIENNFYMWLACRKQQWKQNRTQKRARRQLTPEEDFTRWLKQRKWYWKASKVEREARNTPPLEEDFYGWLAERKKVWRLQRLANRHANNRGLLAKKDEIPHW